MSQGVGQRAPEPILDRPQQAGRRPLRVRGPRVVGTLVATLGVLLGCAITTPCPEFPDEVVLLPTGMFSPAVAHQRTTTTGAPLFTTTFPRGAMDPSLPVAMVVDRTRPAYDASAYVGPGEAISSAVLTVNRETGVVMRIYTSPEGRSVEERWRFRELP